MSVGLYFTCVVVIYLVEGYVGNDLYVKNSSLNLILNSTGSHFQLTEYRSKEFQTKIRTLHHATKVILDTFADFGLHILKYLRTPIGIIEARPDKRALTCRC